MVTLSYNFVAIVTNGCCTHSKSNSHTKFKHSNASHTPLACEKHDFIIFNMLVERYTGPPAAYFHYKQGQN